MGKSGDPSLPVGGRGVGVLELTISHGRRAGAALFLCVAYLAGGVLLDAHAHDDVCRGRPVLDGEEMMTLKRGVRGLVAGGVEDNGLAVVETVGGDVMHADAELSIREPLILEKVDGREREIDDEAATNRGGRGAITSAREHIESLCIGGHGTVELTQDKLVAAIHGDEEGGGGGNGIAWIVLDLLCENGGDEGCGGVQEVVGDVAVGVMAVEPAQEWGLAGDRLKNLGSHGGWGWRRPGAGGRGSVKRWGRSVLAEKVGGMGEAKEGEGRGKGAADVKTRR